MDDSRVRLRQWRPASKAAVLGWWLATLAVAALLGLVVAIVVGVVAYAVAPATDELPGLTAIVAAAGAFVVVGYVAMVAGAVLLAQRYVPPERRGQGFTAALVAVLVVVTALLVLGLSQVNQLVLAVTGPLFAIAVPALIVPRVPLVPAAAAAPRPPAPGPDVSQE